MLNPKCLQRPPKPCKPPKLSKQQSLELALKSIDFLPLPPSQDEIDNLWNTSS